MQLLIGGVAAGMLILAALGDSSPTLPDAKAGDSSLPEATALSIPVDDDDDDDDDDVLQHTSDCDCSWIWQDNCTRQDHCALACRELNPDGPCHTPGGDEPARCPLSGQFTFEVENGTRRTGTFRQLGHHMFMADFPGGSINGSVNLLGNNARLSWRWNGNLLWCSGVCPDGPFHCQEGSTIRRVKEEKMANLRGSFSSASFARETCTASWAHNCQSTRTCCEEGFVCFEKTPNWAACLRSCIPNTVQPGDDGKQYPWTCRVLSRNQEETTLLPASTTPLPLTLPSSTTPLPWTSLASTTQVSVPTSLSPQVTSAEPSPDPVSCLDSVSYCPYWAAQGECQRNPAYMELRCKQSCGKC